MMNRKKKWRFLLCLGMVFCIFATLLSLCLGSKCFTVEQLCRLIFGGAPSAVNRSIFRYVRVPRTMASLLAGAALSVSGAVLQNVLGNKLASPSIIGVNAGAGLGVTLCSAAGILSGWAVSGSAFAGSLFAVIIIFLFSYRSNASKTTVILSGVALNSILNAVCEAVAVLNPDVAALNTEFRVGGFSSISYTRLVPAAVCILVALVILFTLCNELDVAALGDETAQSIGLPVKTYRTVFLSLSALLAGAAVSFSGLLGFVGLIVPHFVRRIIGNESRLLLPLCVLFGGGFVCLCDLASRLLFAPYELPVGILMAMIGGPLFVILLIRYKGGHGYGRN